MGARRHDGSASRSRGSSAARATEIATGISLGIQASPDALIAKARAALDAGYRKVKIKIEPGRDVEWIARRARARSGPART